MKFSTSVVVLATLAFESASAGVIHQHAHRHLHEKKAASPVEEAKRQWTPPPGYDWHTDPGNVWKPEATPAPVASSAAPADPVSSSAPASSSPATTPKSSKAKTNVVSGAKSLLADVSSFVNGNIAVGGKSVLAPVADNGGFAWFGEDGDYVNTLVNDSDEDLNVIFWDKDSQALGKAQYVDTIPPALSVKVPSGHSVPVSLKLGASGGFAAITADTQWSDVNWLLKATIGEFTTAGGQDTTFDVSREWYMHGRDVTIDMGNGCKSSTIGNECAFVCNSGDTCGDPNTYNLLTSSSSWCRKGFRNGQPEGGCHVQDTDAKGITTTFS